MAKQITMPQMGFDMQEGKLVRWLKKPGDPIARNEPVAEIETDKAVLEIESFESGIIDALLVQEGEVVPVGQAIATLRGAGEPPGAPAGEEAAQPKPAAAEGRGEPAAGQPGGAQPPADGNHPDGKAPVGGVTVTAGRPRPEAAKEGPPQRVKASPVARRIAAEHGVELASLQGTGPGGRIVRRDVEAALAQPRRAPAVPAAAEVREPSRMRLAIARRMSESKQQAPHFYVTVAVTMDAALRLRREINEAVPERERVTVNDLVVKACGVALRRHPNVNAAWTGEGIRYHGSADVAIAVPLEEGLITPVLRACDTRPLTELAAEAKELAERARSGRLHPEEYTTGTFTVSNMGMYGVEDFVAIINPPQAAIVAVGSIRKEPVVRDDQIAIEQRMRLTLSADHRVVDGVPAAQFLQTVRELLETPVKLLL